MRGIDFRQWAEWGSSFYGDDPWFFLRELAQNSRDAGARHIEVSADQDADHRQTLTFADDGRGMSREHARKYLFRLYSSSKEGQPGMAGRYGIGFWSILHFGPEEICIASHDGKSGWALTLDSDLTAREAPCPLNRRGTRITLSRHGLKDDPSAFRHQVGLGLDRICGHLRTAGRRPRPLPVTFHGRQIHRPLALPGYFSQPFSAPGIRGVVGLAPEPAVTLLARGLPVFAGRTLDEFEPRPAPASPSDLSGQGLAPVFLIDGDHLEVTYSRKALIDTAARRQMLRVARIARRRLLETLLSRSADERGTRHKLGPFGSFRSAWLRGVIGGVLIALLGWGGATILANLRPLAAPWGSPLSPAARVDYRGAGHEGEAAPPVEFRYQPAHSTWFRLFVARYDLQRGWTSSPPAPGQRQVQPPAASSPPLRASLSLSRGGTILLPCPPAMVVDPNSITLDHLRVASPLRFGDDGAWSVTIPGPGQLGYDCLPGEAPPLPPAARPAVRWPEPWSSQLVEIGRLPPEIRPEALRSWTAGLLRYDATAQARPVDDRRPFLERVLTLGRGDCDVINGVLALALAETGLEARLAIGFRGRDGRAADTFHAWAEFRTPRGWQPLDATPGSQAVAPTPLSPRQSPVSPLLPTARLWGVAVVLGVALATWLHFRRRPRFAPPAEEARNDGGEPEFIELIRGVLQQRQAWKENSTLLGFPLLPTLGGPAMSLAKALRLGKRGMLVAGSGDQLAHLALSRPRLPVLAAGDSRRQKLIPLLPGVLILDDLLGREPILNESPALEKLCREANRRLRQAGTDWPHLAWGSWSSAERSRYLDLTFLGSRRSAHRGRIVLLARGDERWQDLLTVLPQNLSLACYRLLRELWQTQPLLAEAFPSLAPVLLAMLEEEPG